VLIARAHRRRPGRASAAGFTLLETLVVIVITGMLLSIAVVSMRFVLQKTREVKSLSNLRQLGGTLTMYASAHDGRFPFLEPGEVVHAAPPGSPGDYLASFSPVWWLDKMWPTLMHDVAPWPEHFETWLSPDHDREPPYWPIAVGLSSTPVSYQYSNSFLGKPRIWSGNDDVDENDIGPTLVSSVMHPSHKVIMYDAERPYLRGDVGPSAPRPVLFVDGSAASRFDPDATSPVQNPLYPSHGARLYHDTPHGVEGRDY